MAQHRDVERAARHVQDGPAATEGAAERGAQVGASVGAAVGAAAHDVALRAGQGAAAVVEGYEVVRERWADSDPAALVRQWGQALDGVVEDGRERAVAALGVQRRPQRRWPWAVAAGLLGAAAGAGVALALKRVVGQDAPGAQEPEHLRAVVDPGQPGTD